ncbi:N-acetylmuramoyl-L-alanine amidase [Streptomyces sp. NBC_01268]|uniref:peptidoglycan recognition protein family protein n=1 Tax=unclassified Streptomyces TaxID=2593676 RepID=UPI002E3566FF|nr:N-acetylmuramoyl-L-alanine amidase [Streptomyces sp. NBC_01268]
MSSGRGVRRRQNKRVRRTAIAAGLAAATVLGFQAAANGAVFGEEGPTPNPPSVYSATGEETGPVKSEVQKLALTDKGHGEAVLSQRDTQRFGLLGVSWTDPEAKIKGKIQARSRDAETGAWTEWMDLEPYPALLDGKRAGARGSTEPIWVGASDGAEVRVTDGAASGVLPAGLRLDLVDPGAPAKAAAGDLNAETAAFKADVPPTPTGPESTAPRPTIVSRAEWGADESLNNEGPIYLPGGKIKAAFVHHTTDADYDCAQSAALVRAIHVYHVKTNGWRDLGYNFLVDKCGTIFEGRQGGVDQPVLGAHTYGWNSESTSVSIMGNYTDKAAPQAALISASKVIAYKLGQYGVDPAGKATLTAGATQNNFFGDKFTVGQTYTFDAVSGHRNGFNTECPGTMLYPQLPQIRAYATGSLANLKVDSLTGGATPVGSGYETPGPVTVNWSTSTAPNSLISKFEVLVDGQVATTSWGHIRSSAVNVSGYGDHSVAVRGTHTSGKVTTSAPVTVTVPGPKTYKPLTPTRLMDTRSGLGVPKAKVGPAGEVTLQVAGQGGVPATGAGAVVLNVTATGPTATSFVSVYPNGTARTSASNLNFTAGKTIPNLVVVPVVDGKVKFYNHAGSVDLIADVTGYYAKDTSGSTHVNLGPLRLMDTRAGTGVAKAKVGADSTVDLQVAGVSGVPADKVTAVVLNVTATNPTAGSFVSVFPHGTARTSASNLNFTAGQTIPNLVVVPVVDGKVSFYNKSGSVDLLADITGYFTSENTGASHINLGPKRLMDTRSGLGVRKGAIGADSFVTLDVAGVQGVPATGVTAVVLNVTATNPTSGSFVSVYPDGTTRTSASNLNFTSGLTIPNLVVVPVVNGKVNFYNRSGSVDLLADITGYFTK